MATTASSAPGDFLQAVLQIIENDALKQLLPLLTSFLTNVGSNPSQMNIMAQLASLEVQALAALPNLEAAVVKDLAALIQAQVAKLTPTAA